MKEYPSIGKNVVGEKIYAFDKLDGSQVRAEWNKKKKFYKFGTRTRLLDTNDEYWGEAPQIILDKYGKDLHDIFVSNRYEKVICFFEFWGENSFAGTHQKEPHDVTLFDVSVHKKGILLPHDYLKLYGHLDIAKLLYHGNPNAEFIDKVRNSMLEGMTFEGVVCKGPLFRPGLPLMFKVKTLEWLQKLKDYCDGDENMFRKLL